MPDHGKAFSLSLRKCSGKENCKTDDEINEFILSHQVNIHFNLQTYKNERFGDEEIIENRKERAFYPIRLETPDANVNQL